MEKVTEGKGEPQPSSFGEEGKEKTRAYKERDERQRADHERAISVHKKENIVYVDESGIDEEHGRRWGGSFAEQTSWPDTSTERA
ncbi:MAG: hypothetical protein LBB16_02885 [Puniceicoccales bacterium]|nr:hypothetical protein [Puniceicoccales bacterium]